MAMQKVSVTLDADLVAEAKSQVGEREFSRYLNEALLLRLQRARLEQLERELTEEFGPIPAEVQREVDSEEWPR
jgi:Arc/MetJ-type ribon-helix-helix transcriptional regulator